ncbi:AAA family ATPase [Nannocystis sp. ILAH1]|uniref:ArsA family ATPase n=1 Tax=unclassified Nannocystis TaxID=2627009 RepID=UPI00226E44CB|nr:MULTISPECIES: ArsA-related P-loop ATPase [unclassified Nannocystis]MCY0987474.1 AAA family ATPase [Nannocystis sp. ILAH1]MCY1070731.1 AAA family ATPase [Nannocystis sp. RBIL2]
MTSPRPGGDPLSAGPSRRVLLCVGPGGVGKTTCAAALALGAARQGKRVLVVTIDPSLRLAQALGQDRARAGEELPVALPEGGQGSLHALLLAPDVVFDRIVRAYAESPAAARQITQNPIYRAIAENLGGALEYAAMAQLQILHAERRYDLIVLDTPPTANAIDFLSAPERIHEVVTNPATRIITGGGKLGARLLGVGNGVVLKALGAIGGGEFLAELGAFLRDFSGVLSAFQQRAGDFSTLLTSPETGVVLATSASPLSVREGLDFLRVLHDRGLRVDSVVLNRVLPPFPPAPPVEAVRAALAEQVEPAVLDDMLQRVLGVYAGLRVQGEQSVAAGQALTRAYPRLPLWLLPLRDPAPTSVADLAELVAQFVRWGS